MSDSKKPASKPVVEVGPAGIQEIDVLALPVAVNMDRVPGPDGFIIKVFASGRRPKPVALEQGKIEVVMFDGVPGMATPTPSKPRHIWTYTAEELRPFEIRSSVGIGYELALTWGQDKPAGNKITVAVRYTAPDGKMLLSAPSVIYVAM